MPTPAGTLENDRPTEASSSGTTRGVPVVIFIFRSLAITFALVALLFFLFPDGTVRFINAAGALLRVFPPAPESALRFWLSLGVSYMALVTILAALIQRDPCRYRHLMPVLAAGKCCSSVTCLFYFLFSSPTFLYLLNFLLDGSITVVVLGCYLWVETVADDQATVRRVERDGPILEAVIDTLLPTGGVYPIGGRQTPLARDLWHYLDTLSPYGPLGLALLLRAVEYGPYLFGPRRTRFSRLTPEERERYLAGYERSRFTVRRQLINALKLITTLHFYDYPDVQDAVNFDRQYVRAKLLTGPNAAHHRLHLQP